MVSKRFAPRSRVFRRRLTILWCVMAGLLMMATLHMEVANAASAGSTRMTSAATANIDIIDNGSFNFTFNPPVLLVTTGTTVSWSNTTFFDHTTTSDITGTLQSWDVPIAGGAVITVVFDTPGTYTYHCSIHTFMTGTVIVVAPRIYLPMVMNM